MLIKPINEVPLYEVTLAMCTLHKGKPNGLAQILFKHPQNHDECFNGIGVFTDGKLHGGPFSCI